MGSWARTARNGCFLWCLVHTAAAVRSSGCTAGQVACPQCHLVLTAARSGSFCGCVSLTFVILLFSCWQTLNLNQLFRTEFQTWSFIIWFIECMTAATSVLICKVGWDFWGVYLCAILVVSHEKNILKKTCIKFYFMCSRDNCLSSSGAFVLEAVGGIHLSVWCLLVFIQQLHFLPTTLSRDWGSVRLHTPGGALSNPWWRCDGWVKAAEVWVFPFWRRRLS